MTIGSHLLHKLRFLELAVAGLVVSASILQAQVITLDPADQGKIFQGLGAASAGASSRLLIDYPEPQRSEILDYLFKPGYGAALQHLKVEVGADVNSTDGSEPSHMRTPEDHDYTRGYEWWLMEAAKKRNPNIILDVLPWGAPGWVGKGHLLSTDMAHYMVDFIQGAKSAHNLHVDYVGVWNERMYDGSYVKELARELKQAHLDTKIVCCDAYPNIAYGEWSIVDAMKKDPELRNVISAVGVHYPNQHNAPPTPQDALDSGKDLWSSEDQPNPGGGPFLERSWPIGGRILAKQYIANYIDNKFTKTEIWSPITSYYDSLAAPNSGLMYANTPWSGHYEVQSTIWVTAHTTQFAEPGWQYLDAASGRTEDHVSYVSLRSPDRKQWSIVLETIDAAQPKSLTFKVKGGLSDTVVHVWETNDTRSFDKVADVPIKDGVFHYTFEPGALYSLTSTSGQGRHVVTIPPAAPFPFPYKEDFESTSIGRSPRFLADQSGAFEVNACEGREGKCLVQQIEQRPIPWMVTPDPFTLTGDAHWRDYAIDVDVRIPEYGIATVMGRIDSADVFQDRIAVNPSGYMLTLHADGKWQIASSGFNRSDRVLATGNGGPTLGWHRVHLAFRGDQITGQLDHQLLFRTKDTDHSAGQAAVGAIWSKVSFDNLSFDRQ
jgi:galactosylceramidase